MLKKLISRLNNYNNEVNNIKQNIRMDHLSLEDRMKVKLYLIRTSLPSN